MKIFNNSLLVIAFFSINTLSFAAGTPTIHLHINATPDAQPYVKNICLTTNNGFTKSCGDGASRSSTRYSKHWNIATFNLPIPLGADDSCNPYRYANKFSAKHSSHLYVTIKRESHNHLASVVLTDCHLK